MCAVVGGVLGQEVVKVGCQVYVLYIFFCSLTFHLDAVTLNHSYSTVYSGSKLV